MSSEPVFESVACTFCGSSDAQLLFEGTDRLLYLPGEFRVVRCTRCGLLRQDPRPTPETIAFYYPPEYEPYSVAIDEEPSRLRRWDRRYGMRKRQRAIERRCPGGREGAGKERGLHRRGGREGVGELGGDVRWAGDRRNYQRAVISWRDGRLVAETKRAQGSGVLSSMVAANGLVIVPEGAKHIAAGETVRVQLIGEIV